MNATSIFVFLAQIIFVIIKAVVVSVAQTLAAFALLAAIGAIVIKVREIKTARKIKNSTETN